MTNIVRSLEIGLGRPAIAMIHGDPKLFREPILYSCTHDQTYSAECGSRTPYLWNLIQMSREAAWYREQIIDEIRRPIGEIDHFGQLFELAHRFAQQGFTDARRAMYGAVERQRAPDLLWSATELIRLDGFDGLLYSLRRWNCFDGTESHVPWGFLLDLEERDGQQARAQVEAAEPRYPEIARFMARIRSHEEESRRPPNRDSSTLDYPSIRKEIEEKGAQSTHFSEWGKRAKDEQIVLAAADLLRETDENIVLGLLKIFSRRVFPFPPGRLIELAHSEHKWIAHFAVRSLMHFQDQSVRELALEFMAQPIKVDAGVDLIENNYREGDFTLIQKCLESAADEDALHSLGFAVTTIATKKRTREAVPSLLFLYENGPCSICRGRVVKALSELERLPEWIGLEYQFDCNVVI